MADVREVERGESVGDRRETPRATAPRAAVSGAPQDVQRQAVDDQRRGRKQPMKTRLNATGSGRKSASNDPGNVPRNVVVW